MKRPSIFLFAISICFILGCSTSGTSPMSGKEKRQYEQKVLDYSFENLYGSAIAVLQDQGYIIENSDSLGGLIVGEKHGENRTGLFVKYRDVFDCSINLRQIAKKQTAIRYKIQKKTYVYNGYSEAVDSVEEIIDPEVSAAFYNALKTEAERRKSGFN